MKADGTVDVWELLKAVNRLKNADTEYLRAIHADTQPRLSKAGTRYYCAKAHLFKVAGLSGSSKKTAPAAAATASAPAEKPNG